MIKIRIKKSGITEAYEQLNKIQKDNLWFITRNEDITGDMGFDFELRDEEDFEELVKNIPPLKTTKLVKYITGASYGKVFKLANDHILKLFTDAVDVDDDMRWYRASYKALHSGEAKKTTLPVYGVGTFSYMNKDINWVEMAEVYPYDIWAKEHGRDSILIAQQFYFIRDFAKLSKSRESMDLLEWLEQMEKNTSVESHRFTLNTMIPTMRGDEEVAEGMTRREIRNALNAIQDMRENGFKFSDVVTRNIGVLKQSDPADPTFIIFDK